MSMAGDKVQVAASSAAFQPWDQCRCTCDRIGRERSAIHQTCDAVSQAEVVVTNGLARIKQTAAEPDCLAGDIRPAGPVYA